MEEEERLNLELTVKNSLSHRIKERLIRGFIIVFPLILSGWVIWFLINKAGGILGRAFELIPGFTYLPEFLSSVMGFFSLLFIFYVVGLVVEKKFGEWAIKFLENILNSLPVVNKIYFPTKKFTEILFGEKKAFLYPIGVKFPHKDSLTLGFITSFESQIIKGGKRYFHVYVPTTPNPTSGYFLMIPEDEIIKVDLTPDEALRIIITGGVLQPDERKK